MIAICAASGGPSQTRTDLAAEIADGSLLDLTTSGSEATLVFASSESIMSQIEEFVAAESKCCPFFTFRVLPSDESIQLDIEAPEDAAPLTRGLVAGFTAGWRLAQ